MKYLVLGSAGMVGHTLALYLQQKGHEVVGIDQNDNKAINQLVMSVYHRDEIKHIIDNGNFDYIINALGILNRQADEQREQAVFINAYYPYFLREITRELKTKLVQLSTDCVFSDVTGYYTEYAIPSGYSFYAKSKALGEINDDTNLTIRTSLVGPDMNVKGIGLLNWFMSQSEEVNGYTQVLWTGITTLELARIVELATKQGAYGLYNMVPKKAITKYDLLLLFNKYFRNNSIIIHPYATVVANKSLIRTNFAFAETVQEYEIMIEQLATWTKEHAQLYPHYRDIQKN